MSNRICFLVVVLMVTAGLSSLASAQTALFRVNAGGAMVTATDGGIDWEMDTSGVPSGLHNLGSNTSSFTGGSLHPSVPGDTPASVFDNERWDPNGGNEMEWDFNVGVAGTYEVRLYLKNGYPGTSGVGQRVFTVNIEGSPVLSGYDIVADVGHEVGVMKSFIVTSDANLDVDFEHVTENPLVNAIEIVAVSSEGYLLVSPGTLGFGSVEVGTPLSLPLTLTNIGSSTDIVVDPFSMATDFHASFAGVTLVPGASTVVQVTFDPVVGLGTTQETLIIDHDGTNTPVSVALDGFSFDPGAAPISFSGFTLTGESSSNPTTLQFGPDDRLYVGQQNGLIKIYDVARNDVGGVISYSVTGTETLTVVQAIPNHNDDGTAAAGETTRQVTGLLVTGSPSNPVLYVTSSDPRIAVGDDSGLDTNSGIVSRLTWTGSSWDHVQIVRGLPRSEENHSTNGMDLDENNNILYVIQGGNTNKGAPSNNFSRSPETALSAALLSVDLDMIEALSITIDGYGNQVLYDLPTLDDPTRAGSPDAGDPFGGNNGLNQAIWDPTGPVQVHSPGYRNAYDVCFTSAGRLYTFDNGPNGGWGGIPVGEGTPGVTNEANETGDTGHGDNLHFITSAGFYGGHPNPTRANPAGSGIYTYEKISGTWNLTGSYDWLTDFPVPPVPVALADAVQGTFKGPDTDGSLFTVGSSTNGLDEYTASNFGGAMTGQLLAASFNGNIIRFKLNGAGDTVLEDNNLGNLGTPLDVTAQSDTDLFPGTVWSANHGPNTIAVYEPIDYDGSVITCTGAYDVGLDEDNDGFSNADEIDNGTDPCANGSFPSDADGDMLSDLNDPDDDDDGLLDTVDPFSIDPANGTATSLPIDYPFSINSGELIPGTFFSLGFTGLMSNGTTDYLDLFDEGKLAAGGAAGFFTVEDVPEGDAYQAINSQEFAFQFGVDVDTSSSPFMVHTALQPPFFGGVAPVDYQSFGMFLGTGTQDDYLKVVFAANGGVGGVQVMLETAGSTALGVMYGPGVAGDLLNAGTIDLYAFVDPATLTVQPRVSIDGGGTLTDLGLPLTIPAAWLDSGDAQGLALGIISTSTGDGVPFNATWDLFEAKGTSSDAAATMSVTAGSGLNSSTYGNNSFQLTNTSASGQKITRVVIDLGSGIIEDMVFDPDGTAGDLTAKAFTINTNPGVGTVSHVLSGPHGNGGFDILTIDFDGGQFDVAETFGFSIDVDPTTIEGESAPGPGESGSVSGLEMTGATVTVEFDDGLDYTASLYSDGSLGGAIAEMSASVQAAPAIAVLGLVPPVTVGDAAQTVRISGPAGATAHLLIVEAALFEQAGGGIDVQPFEANSAISRQEITGITLDGDGLADVPVTLTNSNPDGGLNHLVAVLDGASVMTSNAVVVEYDPGLATASALYRVNVGGPVVAAADASLPAWSGDTSGAASPFLSGGGTQFYDATAGNAHPGPVDVSDPDLPVSAPSDIFDTERYDLSGGSQMTWEFPVTSGTVVEVRLYFAELFSGITLAGERVFDVSVEGEVPAAFTGVDAVSLAGAPMKAAFVSAHKLVTDGSLSLAFVNDLQSPALKGIELVDVTAEVSAVDDPSDIPTRFALLGAYPNPFNPSTTIAFELPRSERVSLAVYDLQGRLVRELVQGSMPAGRHEAVWLGRDSQGRSVGSGVYLYRLRAGASVETRKIMLVK